MAKSNVGKKPISEEEYTTNKVLTVFSVCLLGVLVLMILQRLLNYGSTFMIGLIVTRILLAIGIIGVVGGLVMLGMERTGRSHCLSSGILNPKGGAGVCIAGIDDHRPGFSV